MTTETRTLPEIDPSTLYKPDGSVDFEACERYVDSLPRAPQEERSNELGELSTESYSLTVDLSDLANPDTVETKESILTAVKEEDPLEFALVSYMKHIMKLDLQFERRFGLLDEKLEKDPAYQPDLAERLDAHMRYLEEDQTVRYELLQKMHDRLTPPTNEVNKLDCIVAIPVAGHQEHGNIYRTLQQFTNQELPTENFEVVLYLNLPGEEGERDTELSSEVRKTIDEIERFREQYPNVPVRYTTTTYRITKPTIGAIRDDLWDVIGYDLKQRGREDDVLVVSADADIIHLNRTYLSGLVETWKETGADFVTANLLWQAAPDLGTGSYVNRMLRYQTFLDNLRDNHATFIHAADANTAVSLAMYFAVGGYDREAKLGEMRSLVNRIRYWRQEDREAEEYHPVKIVEAKSRKSSLKTHSRRLIKAMSLGHAPYDAWDQKLITFGNDDELRTAAMETADAEKHAQENWKKWLKRDTKYYIAEVPLAKKRRVLKHGRRILGFSDLYEK